MMYSEEKVDNKSEEQIRALIAEEEEKREQKYYELGKAFMELYPSVTKEDLMEHVQEVLDIDHKISAYQKEIRMLNGAVFCENCDSELQENAMYCGVCGYKVAAPVIKISEGQARCANCGYIYQKGIHFCINCGTKLDESELEPEVSNVEEESKWCINCGTKLSKDALFCTECGAKQ